MAKMNLRAMSDALVNKSDELMDKVESMKNDSTLSENTVRTQTHIKTHESHNLLIMLSLVRSMIERGDIDIEIPDSVATWFASTTMLTEVRKKGSILLHEGDNVFDIMEQHPTLTMSKLKSMAEKQGYRLDKGVIVK